MPVLMMSFPFWGDDCRMKMAILRKRYFKAATPYHAQAVDELLEVDASHDCIPMLRTSLPFRGDKRHINFDRTGFSIMACPFLFLPMRVRSSYSVNPGFMDGRLTCSANKLS